MNSTSKETIMRMDRCSKRELLLLAAAGLALASSASADDHDKKSGNSRVPSYFAYPRGRGLAQHYSQPSAGIGSLAAFNSSPGSVSPSGSMSVLYQQPATRKLVARECLLLPHSTAQIRLGSAQAGLVGCPQIIHKFVNDDFDPHVAGQPYACFTWDLIAHLKDKFGGDKQKAYDTVKELTLAAAALNPRDVPDAVRLVFFVDHQNGSKFFDEMAKAADAHGIPRPATPEDLNNPANLNLATN